MYKLWSNNFYCKTLQQTTAATGCLFHIYRLSVSHHLVNFLLSSVLPKHIINGAGKTDDFETDLYTYRNQLGALSYYCL